MPLLLTLLQFQQLLRRTSCQIALYLKLAIVFEIDTITCIETSVNYARGKKYELSSLLIVRKALYR